MTVTSTASSTTQQGNGATTSWPFAFPIPGATPTDQSNVKVVIVDQTVSPPTTTVLSNSQYSITGISTVLNPSSAGTVTYPLAGVPLVAGQFITIQRNLPLTQLTSLPNQGPWQPKVVEAMVDYVTEILQGGILGISLALQNDPSDPAGAPATLPLTSLRKNQGAVWDANGNLIAGAVGSIPVNVAMTNLVQAVSVAAARAFLQAEAQSAKLDDIAAIAWAQGDVMYYDGTHLVRLAAGTAAQALLTNGAGANPSWGNTPVAVGSVRNLKVVQASATTATVTADEIVCKSALGGVPRVISGLNVTLNIGTTGANGMDTGAASASADLSLYAISGPGKTDAVLATLGATSNGSIYSGANMPAGYTASALIGSYKMNGSAQFTDFIQFDRAVNIPTIAVVSTGVATTYTNVSLSSVIPANAKSVSGWASVLTGATSGTILSLASDSTPIGEIEVALNMLSASGGGAWSCLLKTAQQIVYKISNASAGNSASNISVSGYTF